MTPTTQSPHQSKPDTRSRPVELARLLTDPAHDRRTNLLRLQGWRNEDLKASARTSTIAHRLGPLSCGTLSIAAIVTGSMTLLLFTFATAVVGVFGRNHPFETLYNSVVVRRGGAPIPPNRAAKRLGCAMGAAFLAAAAMAWSIGYNTVGNGLLGALGALSLFVAATGICLPSMMFTLMFGTERGSRARLAG